MSEDPRDEVITRDELAFLIAHPNPFRGHDRVEPQNCTYCVRALFSADAVLARFELRPRETS